MKIKIWKTCCRENGDPIDDFKTFQEADCALSKYAYEDLKNDCDDPEEDFYEIVAVSDSGERYRVDYADYKGEEIEIHFVDSDEAIFERKINDIQEIAKIANVSRNTVYNRARELGRVPTLKEIWTKRRGRPKKYV